MDAVPPIDRRRLLPALAVVLLVLVLGVVALTSRTTEDPTPDPGDDEGAAPSSTSAPERRSTTTEAPTTTTTAPTTTTTVLEPPDLAWVRFDEMEPTDFGGDDVVASIEGATDAELGNVYRESELAIVHDEDAAYLRQRYEPSSSGSPVVEFSLPFEPTDEVWLSYRAYFEPGWEWVRGGKLPGLGGGSRPTGGDGGNGEDGFSARLMWRQDGRLVVYAYHPDRPGEYGEDLRLSGTVPVGRWFTVTQRIAMNSAPDAYDGAVEVWIDGELRLSETEMRWRTTGDYAVDQLSYSSFYGGSDESWAPSDTSYARFAEFRVASTPEGVERAAPPESRR